MKQSDQNQGNNSMAYRISQEASRITVVITNKYFLLKLSEKKPPNGRSVNAAIENTPAMIPAYVRDAPIVTEYDDIKVAIIL